MNTNYQLSVDTGRLAIENGTANPKWFRPDVDPHNIRNLMQKSDAIAIRDTAIWLGMMIVSAGCAVAFWPSVWSVPFWLVYGVLYGSAADSRWHECGHKTAFKTTWMNNAVYQLASFMIMRNPAIWQASHVRHHTDTIIVGRDPEIVAMRPPDLARIALAFVGVVDVYTAFKRMILHASGRIDPEEATYVAAKDHAKEPSLTSSVALLIFLRSTMPIWSKLDAHTVTANLCSGGRNLSALTSLLRMET